MGSQCGTFYKIIVTLLLGVSHLSLSTVSATGDCASGPAQLQKLLENKEQESDVGTTETPLIPSGLTEDNLVASASNLDTAVSSIFSKDGALKENPAASSGPAGSLSLVGEKSEGSKLRAAVIPKERKETMLTAAQSYFIEPAQSTTTTQRPVFVRRRTARPISSLTEKKKSPVDGNNSNNEIPQGNPVHFNPFRQIVNTSFGKSRGKQARSRSRAGGNQQAQTGSGIDEKLNEIPSSTTEGEPRLFSRRRPIAAAAEERPSPQRYKRPTTTPNSDKSDDAQEAPKPRRFPLRKPRPFSDDNKNSNNNNKDSSNSRDNAPSRSRPINRVRPTTAKPDGVNAGNSEGELPQVRRIRPIRPLVSSRLMNAQRNNPSSTSTATSTSTTTTTESALKGNEEESPLRDILGQDVLSMFRANNIQVLTTPSSLDLSPSTDFPDHINNIINGIGPFSILPGSLGGINTPAPGTPASPVAPVKPPLPPPVRLSGGTGGRQNQGQGQRFVLRPRSSTTSPLDGENEILASRPPSRRRKRPTTTESPDASDNQRHVGGIVGSRVILNLQRNPSSVRGDTPSSSSSGNERRLRGRIPNSSNPERERNPSSIRGGIPSSPVTGNDRNPSYNRVNIPSSAVPVNERNPSSIRGGIPSSAVPGNEINPSSVRGGIPRSPSNSSPFSNGVINSDSYGNEGSPIRGSGLNSCFQRNPVNSSPIRGSVINPDLSENYQDDSPPPLRRIPSVVRGRQTPIPEDLPFPPLPALTGLGQPESYQIRDDPMNFEPLIPRFKPLPDVKLPEPARLTSPVQQPLPLRTLSSSSAPSSGSATAPSGLSGLSNLTPSSPSSQSQSVPIQHSLNSALNLSNFGSPGLFQVPPRDNLGFYPGLDNVLGISSDLRNIQKRPGSHQFSSRTTIIPAESEISNNDRAPSASTDTEAVVLSEVSNPNTASSENNSEAVQETSQPDLTTVTTPTTTTPSPVPTKKLSPYEKLTQNRQAAARKFLTPRKPTEKTTAAPSAKSSVSNLRKSVIPPRTLRSQGKSLAPQGTESVEGDASPQENTSDGNEPEVNNVSSPSSEPDTASNVVPITPTEGEEEAKETSTRKPSILEKAKRRRIPIPVKSSVSPMQQFQAHQQKGRNAQGNLQSQELDAPPPSCEDGERYSKFLKRCVATYKPRLG